ncbi:hypothetical protein M5X17_27850 [Paenibacillus alvei]|uniref:hypothetical protein n=1 Tax=Paenibacillus alvei TaxID=44250 RepID=UPI00227E7953|nr:hypothetical protein [Paenibacillus alvei]MCY9737521.1 hypothetical protein [Paenibacillus alvei]
MDNQAKFGSYAAHQPHYESFKQHGKLDDFVYQALVHMGSASWELSWANTVLEDEENVSSELKNDIHRLSIELGELKERLRSQ